MANPQLENDGYIRIVRTVMDALCRIRINGEARQVLDFIIRKTYGWSKKEDAISLSQFCLATNLKKYAVKKALRKLTDMNLIRTQKGTKCANMYKFNKDFDTWKPVPKKVFVPKKVQGGTQKGTKTVPKKTPTKDTITKDTIQKIVGRFTPPTLNNVINYCKERNRGVNAEKWYNHYQAKGWFIGKTKMKDWKAAVRTWEEEKPKWRNI